MSSHLLWATNSDLFILNFICNIQLANFAFAIYFFLIFSFKCFVDSRKKNRYFVDFTMANNSLALQCALCLYLTVIQSKSFHCSVPCNAETDTPAFGTPCHAEFPFSVWDTWLWPRAATHRSWKSNSCPSYFTVCSVELGTPQSCSTNWNWITVESSVLNINHLCGWLCGLCHTGKRFYAA